MTTAAALTVCIAVEYASPRIRYRMRDRVVGLSCFFFYAASAVVIAAFLDRVTMASHIEPLIDVQAIHPVAAILCLVALRDFLNYWQHRFDHRFLWPVHATHHAPTEVHAANGFAHPLQTFTEFFLIGVPVGMLIGNFGMPLAALLIVKVQSMVQHSPTRVHFGPLRWVFVDNRFHRIHHSIEPRHFGKNYGTVFSIWDQMFGTAYFPAEDEWPDVGVDGVPAPHSLADYLLLPFRCLKLTGLGSIRL